MEWAKSGKLGESRFRDGEVVAGALEGPYAVELVFQTYSAS